MRSCRVFSSFRSFRFVFTLPNWLSGENLWYLQAYGVFILVLLPILKLFESKITRKTHLLLALSLIFLRFFAYSVYLPNLWIASRMMDFIMCYYVGGYISKYPFNISWKQLIAGAGGYLILYFIYEYYWRLACAIEYEPAEYSYVSVMGPFLCCMIFALLCILIFEKMDIPSEVLSKTVKNLASTTMGIYIFHYSLISLSFVFANQFWWSNWTIKGYFIFVIINSVFLFTGGFLTDKIRQWTYQRFETRVAQYFT